MDEITAEYTLPELQVITELRIRPRVTVAAKTDLGRIRENNEDKFEYFLPEDDATLATRGLVFIVCDGMGGHAAGQIASELASKTFIDVYLHHPATDIDVALRSAVVAANRFVHDISLAVPSRRGMGTTLSALTLIQDKAYVAQVGDSRVYRMRDGLLEMLTQDHTWVAEVVRLQMFTQEDAERHQNRHMLTRAIGIDSNVDVDLFTFDVQVGDTFMLCSDGLLNHASDETIATIMRDTSPSEATWKLVNHALQEGGSDNCTVMIVRVDALEQVS